MATIDLCEFCGTETPRLSVNGEALGAVVRALEAGSRTIAGSELMHSINCSVDEAASWVTHLLSCAPAWPMSPQDEVVLQTVISAFGTVDRPSHFTDVLHCDECKEHDTTLRARALHRLERKDLGNPGWDPVSFCTPQAIGHLFPALARFSLLPDVWRDNTWYGGQLLSHLSYGGTENTFFQWCSAEQRDAVAALLLHLAATRSAHITDCGREAELSKALDVWGSGT